MTIKIKIPTVCFAGFLMSPTLRENLTAQVVSTTTFEFATLQLAGGSVEGAPELMSTYLLVS